MLPRRGMRRTQPERPSEKVRTVSEPFKGTINVDIRDSVPDWTPFEPSKAPDGAPNVVYVVLDDVGYSAMSCYGGPIETPNIDRIAADGSGSPSGTPRRCARRPVPAC
jgi:Sulfatase